MAYSPGYKVCVEMKDVQFVSEGLSVVVRQYVVVCVIRLVQLYGFTTLHV